MKISYGCDSKSPIATFTCDCGFVYKRSGPDTCESDKLRISGMVQYGKAWEDKLKELVNINMGLRETARELNVDTNTVKKYSQKLGLQVKWGALIDNKEQFEHVSDGIQKSTVDYRNDWLGLIKRYPQKTKTELRLLNKALYARLYRYDKRWLNENSPQIKLNRPVNNRVDWENRDEEILELVKSEIELVSKLKLFLILVQ